MADKDEGKLILHDRCEELTDQKETYLMEYALDGSSYKIGSKRKELWGVFKSAERMEGLLLTINTFMRGSGEPISFVSNVISARKIINDRILLTAVNDLLKRVVSQQDNIRTMTMAISYSKDLVCADKLDLSLMYQESDKIYNKIKGVLDESEVDIDETAKDE